MTAPEPQNPQTAQAPGRLRQPRPWPYAARPAETVPPPHGLAPGAALPDNDFLRLLPEPALAAGLPAAKPTTAPAPHREPLTAVEALALAPLNRTYWFDL